MGKDEKNKVILSIGKARYAIENYPDYRVISLKRIPRILAVDRTQKYRPVVMGVSCGHYQITAGTTGAKVYSNELGEDVLLSNAHVLHPEPVSPELPSMLNIVQPGRYDGGTLDDTVAMLYKHVPIKVSPYSKCPIARLLKGLYNKFPISHATRLQEVLEVVEPNEVDAAIAKKTGELDNRVLLDDGSLYEMKTIYGLLFAGSDVDNIGIACRPDLVEEYLDVSFYGEVRIPEPNETAKYCGRTTGETNVVFLSNDMTLTVEYGEWGIAIFEHCIVFRGACRGGNSGSILFS